MLPERGSGRGVELVNAPAKIIAVDRLQQ